MKSVFYIITYCVSIVLLVSFAEGHLFLKDGFVGIGLDLSKIGIGGKCPPEVNVTCHCGIVQTPFNVTIPICSQGRWKVKCKLCDDLKEEDICPKYLACENCQTEMKDRCASCPGSKFGKWCENRCTCMNQGSCEQDGRCNCPHNFEGKKCEKRKGCPPPVRIKEPLQAVLTPPEFPFTVIYSCPQNYELKGASIITCLRNGSWSSQPPTCLPTCPLLSAPANGRMTFSANELVEGVVAMVTCDLNHKIVGESTLLCLPGGQWNAQLPSCEKLATCPDPGLIQNGDREIPTSSIQLDGHFIQDSSIFYSCKDGFEHLGADAILCQTDGTWSNELPSCIKVSTIIPNCNTKGSEIVADEGVSVRIHCPPECVDEDFKVWGTSIYRQDSSVCQAAMHSAKITNTGGPVAVINNGLYSHFTGSHSNSIQSDSYEGRAESFRFDKLPPLSRLKISQDCEDKGLVQLEDTCVYISNHLRPFNETQAVCANMGLELSIPESSRDRLKLATILNSKNIKSIWSDEQPALLSNGSDGNESLTNFEPKCSSVSLSYLEFQAKERVCDEYLHYVCVKQTEGTSFETCIDIGNLTNGAVKSVGKIDDIYYVGSSIEFFCKSLYYLKGVDTVFCLGNGSWSDQKPTCIKVNACESPPVPTNGYVTYMNPLKTQAAQRAAIYTASIGNRRTARLPVGLAAVYSAPENALETTTEEPSKVPLPAGLHRIGVRAMYTCESRYYKLIGSGARRCQGAGEWSGRQPTCIPVCGHSDSPRAPFIVNGNATDVGQWPWQAGLARYLPDYKQWFLLCGASLLNERWLVTAAHCVTYAGTTLTIDPDKFQVYLGKYHRQDSKDDEYVQVKKVIEIHIHLDYEPSLFDADIALLHLDSPVQLNTRVQPVCLPTEQTSKENLVEGQVGVVTGWGMNENGSYSDTLQQAVLPVVSRSKCEQGYEESDLPLSVTDNMYCAGFEMGKSDACSGDSGGPMVFQTREKKWVLEGIVSWGSPQGCGNPKQYGGFTTVSKFLNWIHLFF